MEYPIVVELEIIDHDDRLLRKFRLPAAARAGEAIQFEDARNLLTAVIRRIVYCESESTNLMYPVAFAQLVDSYLKPTNYADNIELLLGAGWSSTEEITRKFIATPYGTARERVFFES